MSRESMCSSFKPLPQGKDISSFMVLIQGVSATANTWLCLVIWHSSCFIGRKKSVPQRSSGLMLLPHFTFCDLSPHLLFVSCPLSTDTWLRRTWRTPPSGCERASVPPCAPCWASPCIERFSSSDDQSAWDDRVLPTVPLWTLSLPSYPRDSKWLVDHLTRPVAPNFTSSPSRTHVREEMSETTCTFYIQNKQKGVELFGLCCGERGGLLLKYHLSHESLCKCWHSVIFWSSIVRVRR